MNPLITPKKKYKCIYQIILQYLLYVVEVNWYCVVMFRQCCVSWVSSTSFNPLTFEFLKLILPSLHLLSIGILHKFIDRLANSVDPDESYKPSRLDLPVYRVEKANLGIRTLTSTPYHFSIKIWTSILLHTDVSKNCWFTGKHLDPNQTPQCVGW